MLLQGDFIVYISLTVNIFIAEPPIFISECVVRDKNNKLEVRSFTSKSYREAADKLKEWQAIKDSQYQE